MSGEADNEIEILILDLVINLDWILTESQFRMEKFQNEQTKFAARMTMMVS